MAGMRRVATAAKVVLCFGECDTGQMRLLALGCVLMGCVDSSKLGGSFDCTPGQMEIVGCSANIGRECSGRPRMSLCDGDAIAQEDCIPTTPMPPLLYATPVGGCPNA